jgi:acylphosphatase
MVAKQVIFTGHVQGVGFRFTAHRMASRHQLAGYVRNLPDGSVEMVTQGAPQDIDDCVTDIKEAFPGYVREVNINDIPPDPKHTSFKITF